VFVQFRLDAPGASHVQLAGSFTDWGHPLDLHEVSPGMWKTTLLLEPGVHDYSFIVDGDRWVPDPYAPTVDDGFGGANSRLSLVLAGEPRS
jgi:1,4-alpha-glucan branching enzyme